MAVRLIDGDELELKITSIATLAKSDAQKALMGRVLYCIEQMPALTPPDHFRDVTNMPTLTPLNEPLSIEQLREMDGPVWVACKPIEGGNGYWCLCQRGHIIIPAGSIFDVKEIPHWVFYRRPPEGKEDT